MKDNLESLKSLLQCMTLKSGLGQFFLRGRSHYPTHWGSSSERKRQGSEIQSVPAKRKRKTLPEGQCCQKATTIEFVTVNVAMSLPLIHVMEEMQMFYPITIVNHLKCMGIEPMATELARQSLPTHGQS